MNIYNTYRTRKIVFSAHRLLVSFDFLLDSIKKIITFDSNVGVEKFKFEAALKRIRYQMT